MNNTRDSLPPTANNTTTDDKGSARSMSSEAFLVLGVLASGPATTEYIAMRLKLIRAQVQHIIDELVEKELVEQRQRHYVDRIETYYVLKNENYSFVLEDSSRAYQIAAGFPIVIGSLQRNMARVFKQDLQDVIAALLLAQADLDRESAKQFKHELNLLLQKYKTLEDQCTAPDGRYALVLALYPVVDEVDL